MAKRRKKKRGLKGCGIGPHHEVSPMGHATQTPNKRERQRRRDRKSKQKGWQDHG